MAWGLNTNLSGKFTPWVEYSEFHEKLKDVFENHLSSKQKSGLSLPVDYFYQVSEKFTKDLGPLEEWEKPLAFRTEKKVKAFGDFLSTTNRLKIVQQGLKDAIEAIEPGVHQFWPIELSDPKGVPYPISFYGLVILNSRDSFVAEASDPDSFRAAGPSSRPSPLIPERKYISKLAFSSEIIGDAQLWLETRIVNPKIMMSDALRDEIKGRSLVMPRLDKVRVV